MRLPPPRSTLFPYTTLFRSRPDRARALPASIKRLAGDERVRVRRRHRMTGTVLRPADRRSEEHTSELQSRVDLVCRLLLEKKKTRNHNVMIQYYPLYLNETR